MKRLFAFLIPLFFVLAAACSGGSGPGAVVQDFNTAIAEGDSDAMLEHIDPAMRETLRPKIGMVASLAAQEARNKGGLESTEILSEEVDGDQATVTYRSNFGDGSSEEDTATLRQVDGVWYMQLETS